MCVPCDQQVPHPGHYPQGKSSIVAEIPPEKGSQVTRDSKPETTPARRPYILLNCKLLIAPEIAIFQMQIERCLVSSCHI